MCKTLKIQSFISIILLAAQYSPCQTFDNFQYYTSDMMVNPANTGNHEYEWRLYNHYFLNKSISTNGYESFYLGADYNISLFPDNLSLGLYYKYENLSANPWDISHAYVSVCYNKRFLNSAVRIALQPGLMHSAINQSELLFPDQYDRGTGSFNPGVTTNEMELVEPQTHILLNVGLLYQLYTHNFTYDIGLSVHSIGADQNDFKQYNLAYVYSGFARTRIFLGNVNLDPYLWMNSTLQYFQTTAGLFVDYQVPKQASQIKTITIGSSLTLKNNEHPDAFSVMAGLQWLRLSTFVQYKFPFNFNNSLIHEFNSFELIFIYNGFNANLNQLTVPCDFY